MARVIVLDTSVLIAHFNSNDVHHASAAELLVDAAECDLGASSFTLAEVLVGPGRADRLSEARSALRDIGVAELPVPWGAAERLATLRVISGAKLPDCCVLLAAQDVAAEAVLTFDDRLAKAARAAGFATAVPRADADAVDDETADLRGVPEGGSRPDGTQ